MTARLLPFVGVTALVLLVPGPSVLYAVTQRVTSGRRAGLLAVLGLESGLALHVVGACCGLSAAIAASDRLLRVLQVCGAVYLLWLGIRTLRPRPVPAGRAPTPESMVNVYLGGVLVDVLNPKTVLFVLALLPQFVTAAGTASSELVVLGGLVVAMAFVVDGGYAVLAARLARGRVAARVGRWARRASGGAFLALAVWAAVA